jgi:hypothetical protein
MDDTMTVNIDLGLNLDLGWLQEEAEALAAEVRAWQDRELLDAVAKDLAQNKDVQLLLLATLGTLHVDLVRG